MKRLILTLALAGAALAGCAQLQNADSDGADTGATRPEERSPFPKSLNLG